MAKRLGALCFTCSMGIRRVEKTWKLKVCDYHPLSCNNLLCFTSDTVRVDPREGKGAIQANLVVMCVVLLVINVPILLVVAALASTALH